MDCYQNKQPGPLTNARQVGEGRHLITFQTATEPAQHAGRLGLQVGQTLHLRKDSWGGESEEGENTGAGEGVKSWQLH